MEDLIYARQSVDKEDSISIPAPFNDTEELQHNEYNGEYIKESDAMLVAMLCTTERSGL